MITIQQTRGNNIEAVKPELVPVRGQMVIDREERNFKVGDGETDLLTLPWWLHKPPKEVDGGVVEFKGIIPTDVSLTEKLIFNNKLVCRIDDDIHSNNYIDVVFRYTGTTSLSSAANYNSIASLRDNFQSTTLLRNFVGAFAYCGSTTNTDKSFDIRCYDIGYKDDTESTYKSYGNYTFTQGSYTGNGRPVVSVIHSVSPDNKVTFDVGAVNLDLTPDVFNVDYPVYTRISDAVLMIGEPRYSTVTTEFYSLDVNECTREIDGTYNLNTVKKLRPAVRAGNENGVLDIMSGKFYPQTI